MLEKNANNGLETKTRKLVDARGTRKIKQKSIEIY